MELDHLNRVSDQFKRSIAASWIIAMDSQAPKDKKAIFLDEEDPFQEFPGFIRPSVNYRENSRTFAYRLSESVFGSLLASYVLGFVGFVAVYIQPARQLVVKSSTATVDLATLFDKGHLNIEALAKLFSIEAAESDPAISTIAHLPIYPDGVIIFQYLAISTLFSAFTALIYFNYHRSIMYLTSDQKTSAVDFLLSVLIGVFFGMSMLFPLGAMFFLGLLTLFTLWRKSALLNLYWLYIAETCQLVAPTGAVPTRHTQHKREQRAAKKLVADAFLKSENETLKSWGSSGTWLVWGAVSLAMVPSLAVFLFRVTYPNAKVQPHMLIGNLVICVGAVVILFLALLGSNKKMSSRDDGGDDELDKSLANAMIALRDRSKA